MNIGLRRDDDGKWWFRLSFIDAYGLFYDDVPVPVPHWAKNETVPAGIKRFEKALIENLDATCVRIRKARINSVKRMLR